MRKHNALIVHFSGTPAPRHFEIYFPEDLKRVISGGAKTGLSCSVVKPGDNFDHSLGSRNAYGSIGVILDLKSTHSLRAVHVGDGGSRMEDGVRVFDEWHIDLAALENSLAKRGSEANEWGITDYRPVGIFIADPIEYWLPPSTIVRTDSAFVAKTFPDQPLFIFKGADLMKLSPDGSVETVSHDALYPD